MEIDELKERKGVAIVPLSSIIEGDLNDFLRLLSNKLIGSDDLTVTNYRVIGHYENRIVIEVEGIQD